MELPADHKEAAIGAIVGRIQSIDATAELLAKYPDPSDFAQAVRNAFNKAMREVEPE